MKAETVDTAIIGAGPYGLSIAAYLAASNVEYRLFGSPMNTWKERMPDGMLLRSEGFASNICDPSGKHTLERYTDEQHLSVGEWMNQTPVEVYRDYGAWFIDRIGLPVEDVQLEHLSRADDGFDLSFFGGEPLRAKRVVLAIGLTHFAHVPTELRGVPDDLLSHSSNLLKPSDVAGRKITIVGAGQSALETAALLHEQDADVTVVGRGRELNWHGVPPPLDRPVIDRIRAPIGGLGVGWSSWLAEHVAPVFYYLPASKRVELVGRTFGPAGAWWLRDRVEGKVPVLLGRTVRAARPHAGSVDLMLAGPEGEEHLSTDYVISATGYRVDLGRLAFLDASLRAQIRTTASSPTLSRGFESSVPGLYFAGAAAAHSWGPVMRFVVGAERAAPTIARHLARRSA
jgi:thioredoxin reductase